MNTTRQPGRRTGGYALVTAIIFLVLLTLVALSAIRGTGLELKSAANQTVRAEAFASSEIIRTLAGRQIDLLCGNAGTDGLGTVTGEGAAAVVSLAAIPGLSVPGSTNWCLESSTAFVANPIGSAPDVTYARSVAPAAYGAAWIQRLNIAAAAGAGQAQAAGYGGTGIGAAGGGANIHFNVHGLGTDQPYAVGTTPESSFNTAAAYRYVIRR